MATFDIEQFNVLIDGDRSLFAELLQLFTVDWPMLVGEIRKALAAKDAREVERLGHRLKGNIKNFYAARAAELAAKIEKGGHVVNLEGLEAVTDELEAELRALQAELEVYLRTMA